MTTTKDLSEIALCLILLFTAFAVPLANATTENNYKNDNNFLTDISESTYTENGYKTNILINPDVAGIYVTENGYKLDLTINTQGISGSLKENGYKLDIIPEKTFPDIPNITIAKIVTSKTIVGQGYTILINVTVSNQALNYETLHTIIYANTTTIKTQNVTLTSRSSTTITFIWNTAGFAKGNYTIWAYAWPVPGETDTADNTLKASLPIEITIPGDVDGDHSVTILDVVQITSHYAQSDPPGWPIWPIDLDNDGKITILDVVICTSHYAQKDP
jgi:hypothetical protein